MTRNCKPHPVMPNCIHHTINSRCLPNVHESLLLSSPLIDCHPPRNKRRQLIVSSRQHYLLRPSFQYFSKHWDGLDNEKNWEAENIDVHYTVFTDSTAAIDRAATDRCGPEQAFARGIAELAEDCSTTLQWTLAHKGIGGNEVAEDHAKWAAENPSYTVG